MKWLLDKIGEVFGSPLAEAGFQEIAPCEIWWAKGHRYAKGQLIVEVTVTAESGHRIEVWLRKKPAEALSSSPSWSAEDIELPKFCQRNHLSEPVSSPSLVEHKTMDAEWELYFKSVLDSLLKALALLPRADIY